MSDNLDNVTQLDLDQPPEPRKGLIKKIVLFSAAIAAVCSVLALILFTDGLNMDSIRRWVKYMNVSENGTYGTYAFDSHGSNRYGEFDDGLAIASVSGLNTYDENGGERFIVQEQLALPQLLLNDQLAVAYDVGGHSLLAVDRKNGEVLRLKENRPILDADLSSGGYLCTSSSASGYKSVLSVYNPNQDLIYRWLSSTTYIPLCAVSPDGKQMAAVALGQSDGVFESSIHIFATNSEEIQQTISLGSELIYDLMFVDGSTICAVGEDSVIYVSASGELLGSCTYGENYLKDFNSGGNGFLTLSLNMYRAGNRYSLLTVDNRGRKIAELYLGSEVLSLSANGRYIAVLTPEALTIYTENLSVYHETVETGNATAVLMREDGSVLLLGNGQGRLYIP